MKSLKKLYVTLSFYVAMMIIIIASIGYSYIQEDHNQFLLKSKENSQVDSAIHEIADSIRSSVNALEDLFLLPEDNSYLDAFYTSNSEANVTISAILDLNWQTTEKIRDKLIETLRLVNVVEEIVLLEFSDTYTGDIDNLNKKLSPLLAKMLKEINEIDAFVKDLSNQELQHLTESKNNLVNSVIVIALLGLVMILGILFVTNNFVLIPLKTLTEEFNKEALGEKTGNLAMPKHLEMKYLISAFINMRQQIKFRQSQLEHQALHDELTGLPNRSLLLDRIKQSIKDSKRNKIHPVVILMDLDRFKEINDTLGHHVGDILLQEIGRRLLKTMRNLDTVARLGGDEFAILLHDTNSEDITEVTNKITNTLSLPFEIEAHQFLIRSSLGIALYPQHGETEADLLKHADIAMYIAKRNHLGHCIYDPDKNHHDISHISLSSDLISTMKSNELELYYQPKVDSKTGKVISLEALLRWNHSVKGYISPEFIVEVAEQSGLIQQLTEWVLKTAIKQAVICEKKGMKISIGVNLSVFNLHDSSLVDNIFSFLDESQLDPSRLILEVTESSMMLNPDFAASVLTRLNERGLKISIDDFGTGYSSLAYLKNLPVQELKIDRSFVMNLATDKSDISIVKSIIDLAHNLGLSVVAEGVENQDSWDILKDLNCDLLQGYFFTKPLPIKEFYNWHKIYSSQLRNSNC